MPRSVEDGTANRGRATGGLDMAASKSGFSIPADKQKDVVEVQRDFMHVVADRIEKGAPFARAGERKLVAGIVRAWARQLPDSLDGAPGASASIDAGYAAIHFACLVNAQGRTREAAARELAGLYGVAPEDVVETIAPFEASAMRLVPKKK
jgi:hypothetical protein